MCTSSNNNIQNRDLDPNKEDKKQFASHQRAVKQRLLGISRDSKTENGSDR